MIIHCPICNAEASSLPRTGLANGFDCPNHGRFKVSDTVLAMPAFTEAPRAQWDSRALSLVQRAYVLESGCVTMSGTSAELANNKQVQAAYLGI